MSVDWSGLKRKVRGKEVLGEKGRRKRGMVCTIQGGDTKEIKEKEREMRKWKKKKLNKGKGIQRRRKRIGTSKDRKTNEKKGKGQKGMKS